MKKRNLYNKQNIHSVHVTFVCTSYGGTKKEFDIALMYYDVCEKCKLNESIISGNSFLDCDILVLIK